MGASSCARARHDHVRRVAAHRGRRSDRARESPLVSRRRLPDEARVLVLAPPGSLGDRGRRRDVRAVRARAMPRIPRRRRLAADSAAHGGGARRARRARFARAGDQLVGRRRGGGRRGHAGRRARRCRRRRAESRRGDSLRAGAAGVANAPPAGELAGQRDEGARRVSRAVLARRRALGRGLRATSVRARALRQLAAVGIGRRPVHVSPRRAGRVRRTLESSRAPRARPRGNGEARRPRSPAGDGLHRDRLVGGGVDARGVRLDVRHRRSHALRRGHAPPGRSIHWACSDISGFGHMHMEGAVRSGEAAATAVLAR